MANNIAKDYVSFEKKSIMEYLKVILDKYYKKDICELLVNKYIEIRYYDYSDKKYSKYAYNIEYYLKEYANDLMLSDKDNQDKIKLSFLAFKYIFYFDDVISFNSINDVSSDIALFRKDKLGILDNDDFIKVICDKYKEFDNSKKNYFKSIQNDKFEFITMNTNKKNVYLTDIGCNIVFPRIYSSYSIKKVYNQGIINEDKLFILYHLVNMKILRNRIVGIYDRDFIVDFPLSLISKKEKVNRLLNIINDDTVRDNVFMKINFKDYNDNKEFFDSLISTGYHFAINLDDSFKYDEELLIRMNVFGYLIDNSDKLGKYNYNNVIYRK